MRPIDGDAFYRWLDDTAKILWIREHVDGWNALTIACDHLDEMPTIDVPQWISVEDRLPEIGRTNSGVRVIAACQPGYVMPLDYRKTLFRGKEVCRWHFPRGRVCHVEITHWQPLPPPPERSAE